MGDDGKPPVARRAGLTQTGLASFFAARTAPTAPPPAPPAPRPPAPTQQAPLHPGHEEPTPAPPPPLSLNEQQRAAAEWGDGLLSVEAGPGSGKTRVIAARVQHLCVARGVSAHQILVLTFSNKASAELVARVAPRAPGVKVGTFHAICSWMLRLAGAAVGVPHDFKLATVATQRAIIREAQREVQAETAAAAAAGGNGERQQKRPRAAAVEDERRPGARIGFGDECGDGDDERADDGDGGSTVAGQAKACSRRCSAASATPPSRSAAPAPRPPGRRAAAAAAAAARAAAAAAVWPPTPRRRLIASAR